jgi:hypothetical protein
METLELKTKQNWELKLFKAYKPSLKKESEPNEKIEEKCKSWSTKNKRIENKSENKSLKERFWERFKIYN